MHARGYEIGWTWGLAYATGSKQVRSAIRRKLSRMASSDSAFVAGIWTGFGDLAEQRADHIEAGRVARTIRPGKLRSVLSRCENV